MNQSNMHKRILWITETAVMLALLVALQWATGGLNNQFLTGSCVNLVLAVTALTVGLTGGLAVALVSPVMAYLLGIAPQILTVPAIMVGNALFVLLLHFIADPQGRELPRQAAAVAVAALAKFAALYLIVVKLICGPMAQNLMEAGALKKPMIAALTVKFSWPQLVTALVGGAVAMMITPLLRRALKK